MKKLIVILLSFFPLIGLAKSDYINIECPTYDVGDTIECKIYTNVNYAIRAIDYEFKLPEQLQLIEFNKDNIWQGELVDNRLYLYTNENQIGKVLLGNIKIKVISDINNIDIQSVNLTYTDEHYNDKKVDVNSIQILEVKKNDSVYYVIIIIGIILIVIIVLILIVRRRKV